MKIDLYTVCYNEELILPYFFRHYKQFCDNITIFDNYSTDNSIKIAQNAGANIIQFNTNNIFDDNVHVNIKNNCWKESKADWVIIIDVDEFVYHPNLIEILKKTNATIITPKLYHMYSDIFPTTTGQIYDEIKMGLSSCHKECSFTGDKINLFKPLEIKEINYLLNHNINPIGNICYDNHLNIKTLHFRNLSIDYEINRCLMGAARFNEELKKLTQDHHPTMYSPEKIIEYHKRAMKKLIRVID
jgi:glycosyltransferase involved in cell wall biosynthesis